LSRADALDVLQDAMVKVFNAYQDKPEDELPALFYTVLKHCISDFYRKEAWRKRLFFWQQDDDPQILDGIELSHLAQQLGIDDVLIAQQQLLRCYELINQLSEQQREVFLLRAFGGLSEAGVAQALGIQVGSVKTQYFRAKQHIVKALGDVNESAA
jgi:RNA polymerase sigma-70 factor (ECF subfamily)